MLIFGAYGIQMRVHPTSISDTPQQPRVMNARIIILACLVLGPIASLQCSYSKPDLMQCGFMIVDTNRDRILSVAELEAAYRRFKPPFINVQMVLDLCGTKDEHDNPCVTFDNAVTDPHCTMLCPGKMMMGIFLNCHKMLKTMHEYHSASLQ